MKKGFLICLSLLLAVISAIFYRAAVDEKMFNRLEQSGLVSDIYRYGDLYSNTNLVSYREEPSRDTINAKFIPLVKDTQLNLYVVGDSYTQAGRVDDINFRSSFYQYGFDLQHDSLNCSKKNILIFERTERYLRKKAKEKIKQDHPKTEGKFVQWLAKNPDPDFYNTKKINERLEYLLFNNALSSFFKEQKAMMNYSLFQMTDAEVYVSKPNHLVYLSETIDSIQNTSPLNPLTANDEQELIDYLNSMYDEYKEAGFDEVYFSPIPEKVRVYPIHPQLPFNTLFNIFESGRLKMPVISCLRELKASDHRVFFTCDTHWNTEGINIWLKKVDEVLKH